MKIYVVDIVVIATLAWTAPILIREMQPRQRQLFIIKVNSGGAGLTILTKNLLLQTIDLISLLFHS